MQPFCLFTPCTAQTGLLPPYSAPKKETAFLRLKFVGYTESPKAGALEVSARRKSAIGAPRSSEIVKTYVSLVSFAAERQNSAPFLLAHSVYGANRFTAPVFDPKKETAFLRLLFWCRRRDLNPHEVIPQRILSPPRLPFHHFGTNAMNILAYRKTNCNRFRVNGFLFFLTVYPPEYIIFL